MAESTTSTSSTSHRGRALLNFITPAGARTGWEVQTGPDGPAGPGSPLRVQLLTVTAAGGTVLQKRVPRAAGAGRVVACDLLDNEIRAGMRLLRRYGEASYPPELVRLVGYNVDDDEPFVLLSVPQGGPIAAVAGRLYQDDQRRLLASLFSGLLLLSGAQLVHGDLTPAAITWDDASKRVQIGDFTAVTLFGEPYVTAGTPPWAAPDRRKRGRVADPRDDVWSASLIAFQLVTGRPVDQRGEPPNLETHAPALAGLLTGVFNGSPRHRPDPSEVLRRLNASDTLPPAAPGLPELIAEGRASFDALRAQKWPPPHTDDALPEEPGAQDPSRVWRARLVWVGLIVGVAAVLALVAWLA
jgi:serine/threonine protein kinase